MVDSTELSVDIDIYGERSGRLLVQSSDYIIKTERDLLQDTSWWKWDCSLLVGIFQ